MQKRFTSRDIAAAIIFDLRKIDGSEKYLQHTNGSRLLIDRFARTAEGEATDSCKGVDGDLSAKSLRARLSARMSGSQECVYTFYNAVLAYDEQCETLKPGLIEQESRVALLGHIIIGEDRSVDIS